MTLVDRQLQEVWNALRSQSSHRRNVLLELRIRNLRGIIDLRVPFNYPVCVLAGPNGCGKSTVLFSAACAYRVPGRGSREFVPSSLFPNFKSAGIKLEDTRDQTELEFHYLHDNERISMMWKRGKAWNRSYMRRQGGKQPERQLYLRTLANLTNPSEVRSLLQIGRMDTQSEQITDDMLIFAHRVLPRRYRSLSKITARSKDLLFAELEGTDKTRYSEFHMSSGERAVLRISKDISNLYHALILIDEVEAGLHPYTQQQAMLEFQRIALRNNLQIIVASHSPVVLDSVPEEGRLFLDRDEDTSSVRLLPPYRDILQKALYGQSRDQLSILCEDEVAEKLILGFLDVLNVQLGLSHDDVTIGRDTGKDEFPSHVRTLAKFDKLKDFILVLDGDAKHMENKIRTAAADYGQSVRPIFLPGKGSPEAWIWDTLERRRDDYAELLGVTSTDMEQRMSFIKRMVSGSLKQEDRDKTAIGAFAEEINRSSPDIARIVGHHEAQSPQGELVALLAEVEEMINAWRQT